MSDNNYDADNIQELEGLDGVRMRPGMYIGSTSKRGLHHMVQEVVDNSVDEAMAGYAETINVTMHRDGSVSVEDNGRGIPIEDKNGEPAINVIMTSIHAGGKFDSDAYEFSGGLHGVGVSVVNALSTKLIAEIKKNGFLWKQVFENGEPQGIEKIRELDQNESSGTTIRFWPSDDAFETTDFDYNSLRSRIENLSYLNPGILFTLEEESDNDSEKRSEEFYFEEGISEFVEHLNEGREAVHTEVIRMEKGPVDTKQNEKIAVDVALQYTDSTDSSIYSFANNIDTTDGGSHETGFKTSLTRIINKYAEDHNLLDEIDGERLGGEIVREGLTAVISIMHSEPQFEGQTKTKLGNSDARGVVSRLVSDKLTKYLEKHPDTAESIANKSVQAYKAKQAAQKAEKLERKTATTNTRLPGKLADCQKGTDPKDGELFVVEGDSAGGCFTGDTEIALASGNSMTFRDLVKEYDNGNRHHCYTVDKDGRIQIGEIKNPRITEENADLVKVKLSNGDIIECTPDHKFMLRDGSYCEAENLEPKDSLMPLYRKESDTGKYGSIGSREMIKQPVMNGLWEFTHLLDDRHNVSDKLYDDIEEAEELSKDRTVSFNQTQYNNTLAYMKRVLDEEGSLERYDDRRSENSDQDILTFNKTIERFFGDKEELIQTVKSYNHRVSSVEYIERSEDVYDIEVPKTHNFALESGVFVHNSAKQARNPENQAILPLRGKILNVEKNRLNRILEHDQIQNLITALGTGIDDEFNIDDLRYHTIILFVDADVDGAHIKTLLLTFLFRYMPELLENGHVYAAKSPLYRIKYKGRTYDSMTEKEREKIVEEKCNGDPDNVQRFKGLGEMNPQQLWDATMDPEERRLQRITIDDAAKADRIFSVLMGSQVEPRREFIRDNSDEADWIDI